MAEAKVFPMNAFVSVLRGEAADQTQLDMLAYITQAETLDADIAPVAQALSRITSYNVCYTKLLRSVSWAWLSWPTPSTMCTSLRCS